MNTGRLWLCTAACVPLWYVALETPATAVQQHAPSILVASARVVANRTLEAAARAAPAAGAEGAVVSANRAASIGPAGPPTADVEEDVALREPETLIAGLEESADDAGPAEGQLVAFAAQQPAPPAAAPGAQSLIQSIEVAESTAKRITLSRDSTATVNLRAPIDKAEIRDPTTADVIVLSPTQLMITGHGTGMTQLSLKSGETTTVVDVAVEPDISQFRDLVRTVSPTARVQPRIVNGTLVLLGTVPDAATADRVVELAGLVQAGQVRNQLTVAGVQQTLLRVVVAEVNKDASRQLGVNWAMGASDLSRDFFFANNLNQINPTVFSSSGLPNVLFGQMTYAAAATGNGVATNLTFGFPRAEFQMFVNALRENGLFRVLAEPNLAAISGQTASFLAGGEVPIPVAQGGAVAGAIVIEYKEFGVRLMFTPTVVGGQIVRMHVLSELSDAVPGPALAGGLPVFSFTTRRVETTIECGNGQTFAIAGLLSQRVQAIASKIPGLGDLPVLGALFSSVDYQRNDSELIVLVTPELVEPLDPHQVPPPPGSLMTDPNDFELFAMQRLEGPPHARPELNEAPRHDYPVNTRPQSASWPTTQLTLRGPWGMADVADN